MSKTQAIIHKSIDTLRETAHSSSELAKVQRLTADKQHEGAHKLEILSTSLKKQATELQKELEKDAALT